MQKWGKIAMQLTEKEAIKLSKELVIHFQRYSIRCRCKKKPMYFTQGFLSVIVIRLVEIFASYGKILIHLILYITCIFCDNLYYTVGILQSVNYH
jgi:hypothetical protein